MLNGPLQELQYQNRLLHSDTMWLNLWHWKRILEPLRLAFRSKGMGRGGYDSSIQRPHGLVCNPESKLHFTKAMVAYRQINQRPESWH